MMKVKNLINTFLILLLIISVECCGCEMRFNKRFSHENIFFDSLYSIPKIISYPIDNEDPCKIGFIVTENDVSIGVTSLCIVDHFIYLTDEYHKNIKRIDILTSELICSTKLTDSTYFKQFNDIIEFNNKLYISSSENNIFVISRDLKKTSFFKIPTKGGYPIKILSLVDSTLDFCVEVRDSAYRMNTKNDIVLSRKLDKTESNRLTNYFDIALGNIRYKTLNYTKENEDEFFILGNEKIKLIKPFEYSSDAYNVDFDDEYLVIFEINTKEFTLYIYPVENSFD